jgi:hypothetical protein
MEDAIIVFNMNVTEVCDFSYVVIIVFIIPNSTGCGIKVT